MFSTVNNVYIFSFLICFVYLCWLWAANSVKFVNPNISTNYWLTNIFGGHNLSHLQSFLQRGNFSVNVRSNTLRDSWPKPDLFECGLVCAKNWQANNYMFFSRFNKFFFKSNVGHHIWNFFFLDLFNHTIKFCGYLFGIYFANQFKNFFLAKQNVWMKNLLCLLLHNKALTCLINFL